MKTHLEDYMFNSELFDYDKLKEKLKNKIKGQDKVIDSLVDSYKTALNWSTISSRIFPIPE